MSMDARIGQVSRQGKFPVRLRRAIAASSHFHEPRATFRRKAGRLLPQMRQFKARLSDLRRIASGNRPPTSRKLLILRP
jgi:hypothetical protein